MMTTVVGRSRTDKISKKHSADVGEVYTLKVGAASAAQQNLAVANIQAPSSGEAAGKAPSMLRMDADSIVLQVGSSKLTLTADAIYLEAKDVHVVAGATASIDAPEDVHLNSGRSRPAPAADGAE
jgi:type VI secretion system secreted protein VgrG